MASIAIRAASVMLVSVVQSNAAEQPYPARPVSILASAVGTTSDLLSRQLAQRLTESWGKTVVVDSRASAAGAIHVRAAVAATPDGYTFVMGETNNLVISPLVFDKPAYDPLKDLAPVMTTLRVPGVLLANPSFPVSNLRELVAYAKQHPGKVTWASVSAGSSGHLYHALLKQSTGVDILHVPYKGAAAAMVALMTGEAQVSTAAASTAMAQIKTGKVKVLAVLNKQRSPALPDVPTSAESGLPDLASDGPWFALAAPARTPAAIIARVNRDVTSVLNEADFRERWLSQSARPSPSTPEELTALICADIAKWRKVVKAAGIRMD